MTLRKGKIWRECKRCGRLYEPRGRFERLCGKCRPKRESRWLLDIQNKLRKKK